MATPNNTPATCQFCSMEFDGTGKWSKLREHEAKECAERLNQLVAKGKLQRG